LLLQLLPLLFAEFGLKFLLVHEVAYYVSIEMKRPVKRKYETAPSADPPHAELGSVDALGSIL